MIETKNESLNEWLQEVQKLCRPQKMVFADGSNAQQEELYKLLVEEGIFTPIPKRPGSFLARSAPEDVARVESRTFICTPERQEAGPTNNWADPEEMKQTLTALFDGCMEGKTCYVIPFCMGPVDSDLARFGVQITDSPYVVVHMRLMTRMGEDVWNYIDRGQRDFIPCWHSVGSPARMSKQMREGSWPCDPENIHVVHFPHLRQIWSYGSGYGGNALLGKKCLALRIASAMAPQEGFLAEHMLIMGVTNPQGEKRYIAAAFPSACGKTNLAMMQPSLKGWKVECVGDDIAWMRFDAEGRLRAINPEAGFFGVAPGTSYKSNPVAMEILEKGALYTNVALTGDGDVWWEGMGPPPARATDWLGDPWTAEAPETSGSDALEKPSSRVAAHPNARFTAPLQQCPSLDPAWNDPRGVIIDAIIFGGRRSRGMPLAIEASDWVSGVLMGAGLSSEKTAAATGTLGELRHDPFAMLPFCGYNMADYFNTWLSLETSPLGASTSLSSSASPAAKRGSEPRGSQECPRHLPLIFYVNWFAKGDRGDFLWPGFGENSRVIQWIFDRCQLHQEQKFSQTKSSELSADACDSPSRAFQQYFGTILDSKQLDLNALNLTEEALDKLFRFDREHWSHEVSQLQSYFKIFGEHMPRALIDRLKQLEKALSIHQ